jgi:outer membrane protein assembly factor BamB
VGEREIYVGSHGGLEAYPRVCPRPRCERLWLLGPSAATSSYPTVTAADGDVYVNNGRYEGGIDPRSPEPSWLAKFDRTSERDLQAASVGHVSVDGGVAYMAASRLYAFPVACGGDDVCLPAWKGPRQYDQQIAQYRVWSDPVVANGLVFASTDRPYAFAVGCGTGGQVCEPLWIGPEGFASKPAVSDSAVAVTYADGRVVVFEATAS